MSTNTLGLLRQHAPVILSVAMLALAFVHPTAAHAASAGGGNLPWDTPLQTLKQDISGPVAMAISLLGIVVCGMALIWGGEINEFVRRIIMVVLVVAVLVGANSILSTLFSSGAVVGYAAPPSPPHMALA